MKPYRLLLPLALALAALAAGSGHAAVRADGPSAHTDALFYTTDSQSLALALGAAPAPSTDYWISVQPYTAGANIGRPKYLPAGPVIHSQGPQFHILAEIRLRAWCASAAVNGWYATGKMLHAAMLAEGFDPTRDAWAINEVGIPSIDQCSTPLYSDESARRSFQQFVAGLHDGAPGDIPIAGVVFAASPAQLATAADVASYRQGLAAWYADAPFWQDMDRYVRFWAQETYADARAWGVAGATAAERSASLNDYFMFGRRLAAGVADQTARRYFAHAYTPLGNASWKQPAPVNPYGPGYGETDLLTPDRMKGFISGQVTAFRSSTGDRFGFAVVPAGAGADKVPIETHVGAAITASQTDAAGACTIAACDAAVDGAAFADAWRSFASPPVITADVAGDRHADGWYSSDVSVGWTVDAMESPVLDSSGCDTTVVSTDTAGTTYTCTVTNRGGTSSTSVTVQRDTTPPSIVPVVDGARHGDWYTGDVTVAWTVSDDLSPIGSTNGCTPATVTSDTAGVTFTCTATSDGGTATQSVTVARDATPPTLACTATPSVLWPPNGKLVPVQVDVQVNDALSGGAGFVLAAAPAEDAVGFAVGTADVTGSLVARKAEHGGRTYTLTYVGQDAAGNTGACDVEIVVPHDQRG